MFINILFVMSLYIINIKCFICLLITDDVSGRCGKMCRTLLKGREFESCNVHFLKKS